MSQEENQSAGSHKKKFSLDVFVEENQRNLMIIGGVLILLAAGMWYYNSKYKPKQEAEANDALFMAERYFGQDSMNLAMNGDGNHAGLLEVAEEFGGTKAGKRAHYYVGVALMKEKKFDEAIEHLKKVKFDDLMVGPLTQCLIGDCYAETDQLEEAAKYYMKGAKMSDNDFTTPYAYQKAGRAYSELGEWADAAKCYRVIKEKYSETRFSDQIDKFIARAETAAASE